MLVCRAVGRGVARVGSHGHPSRGHPAHGHVWATGVSGGGPYRGSSRTLGDPPQKVEKEPAVISSRKFEVVVVVVV